MTDLEIRTFGHHWPVGDSLIPEHVYAIFDRPELSPHRVRLVVRITFDDRVRPEIEEVSILRRPGGPPMHSADLRLPVSELLTEVLCRVLRVATPPTCDASRKTPSGRWRLTPEHLAQVLAVYRRGELFGAPVMHVAEYFGVPRPTASRWIQAARKAPSLSAEEHECSNDGVNAA